MKSVHTIVFDVVKERWKLSIFIILVVFLAVVFALWPPLVLGQLIDSMTRHNQLSMHLLFLYFGTLVLNNVCLSLRDGLLVVFGQKITHALRTCMMEKQICLNMKVLSKQEPGALVSRFISDVDQVELLFTSGIISLFADALEMVSILFVIYTKTKGLFILLLFMLPIVYGFTRFVQKRMLKAQSDNRKAVSKANAFIPETIHNLLTVKNLHVESYMEKQYDEFIQQGYQALTRTNFYDAVYSPVILILNAVVIAIVMLFSANANPTLLLFFSMSAGSAVTIMNYVTQIFSPIESIGMEIQTIQSALAGVMRINEFLDLEEKEGVEKVKDGLCCGCIEIQDVSFGYDEKLVLNHFNLKIDKGAHITIQGKTGGWKKYAV